MRPLRIVLRALILASRYPLRSLLTIATAGLGVCGAVCSLNYALGGRERVIDQFDGLGVNVLIVSPQQSRAIAGRSRTGASVTTLTAADLNVIRKYVPQVRSTAATFSRAYVVKAADLVRNGAGVVGVEESYFPIRRWNASSGRLFTAQDERRSLRVAVLGSTIARDLFADGSPLGQRLFINRVPFEVVGVLNERGQSLDATNEDVQIYIPLATATRRLANLDYYSSIVIEVERWDLMDLAAVAIERELLRRHPKLGKLAPDFQVQSQKQLLETQLAVSSKLLGYIRWVQACTMLVSGLGVLAISWITVKERTREIGARRAVGATRADIFLEVLSEALFLSITGCALGILCSWQISGWIARWALQPNVYSVRSAIAPAGFSLFLAFLFSLLPARSATQVDPTRALRFE